MKIQLKWKQVTGLIFASPAIIYFLVFFIYPFVYNIVLSFNEWDLLSPMKNVGFNNFVTLTKDVIIPRSILATVEYVVGATIPICILALAYALWFNNEFRGKRIYLTIFLMATLIGLVPSLMAWKILFHQEYGLFNKIFFYSWGYPHPLNWLNDPSLAMIAVIITSLSTGIPYYAIYLIGGLTSIPVEYYEVAKLEGANFIQRLWYVILPAIRPVYLYVIIVALISGFQYIGPFYILTGGGPVDKTRVLSLYAWQSAFKYNRFGYAAAITVVLLIVLVPVVFFALRIGRSEEAD